MTLKVGISNPNREAKIYLITRILCVYKKGNVQQETKWLD